MDGYICFQFKVSPTLQQLQPVRCGVDNENKELKPLMFVFLTVSLITPH